MTQGKGIRTHLLVFEDDMQGREGCRRDETPEVELVDVQDVVLEGLAQLIQDRVLVLQKGNSPGVTLARSYYQGTLTLILKGGSINAADLLVRTSSGSAASLQETFFFNFKTT